MSDPSQTAPPPSSASKAKVFKTRANVTRRSKAEREEYVKQEAERAAARVVAAQQASAAAEKKEQSAKTGAKRNLRDGRGEGGSMGTSGVFGAGTGSRASTRGRVQDVGRSELLEGGEGRRPEDGVKSEPGEGGTSRGGGSGGAGGGGGGGGGGGNGGGSGGGGFSRGTVRGDGTSAYDMDEEVDVEPKRDIERIELSSDEDEDQDIVPRKGKARAATVKPARASAGLRPVRAPRLLDEDQDLLTSSKDTQKQAKSSRMIQEDDEGDEVDGEDMQLGDEPVTDEELVVKKDMPSSPEVGKKKPVKRLGTKSKDSRIATETVEERAERLRYKEDVRKMHEEFVTSPKIKTSKLVDNVTDTDYEARNEGKLYLFQFPPLIPFLADAAHMPSMEQSATVKKDPDDPEPTGQSSSSAPLDTSTAPPLPTTKVEGLLTAEDKARLPAGRVGKLRIHKSGKVSLDWGGTDMEVRHGTEVNFLQDAVLIETPTAADNEAEKDQPVLNGKTYALGQIQKKMVVVPDWQKLYD